VTWDAIVESSTEVVVLMPCGMPIDRTLAEIETITGRPGWHELPAVRDGRVYVVDASSFFNRPGPRVVRGTEILFGLFHPGASDVVDAPSRSEARRIPTP
jgi:iron complex transport system substrate-binding protein